MNRELLSLATELHRAHRPFVIASVVWSRAPSSGKEGGSAIIEADGTIHGWIGGACAEPSVIREARRVIKDGTPRLMYLGPADEIDGAARDGVVTVPISCASEGALEVFMEPVLPQPHVVVIGRSPAVGSLARLALALDWRVTVVDDGGDGDSAPEGAQLITSLGDLTGVDDTTPVVVATQGHYDEPALEAALATAAPFIGLVSSKTRAQSILGYLRDRGYDDEQLARIVTPAGLDLGHIEHREIAVAILAQLVALKGSGDIGGAAAEPAVTAEPATAIDPVCGMTVEVAGARFTALHEGIDYYFCCPACRKLFVESPASYLTAAG